MTIIIKNETQRLYLNALQIWVAFLVLSLFPRDCRSCHIYYDKKIMQNIDKQ